MKLNYNYYKLRHSYLDPNRDFLYALLLFFILFQILRIFSYILSLIGFLIKFSFKQINLINLSYLILIIIYLVLILNAIRTK